MMRNASYASGARGEVDITRIRAYIKQSATPESVLNQHPAVKASAVAATPDEVRGDEVLACIVMREGADASQPEQTAASIVQHALAQLAYYKAPGYVAFVDALPLTPSQKIQRGQLREMAHALPGQAHCIDTRAMKKRQVGQA